MRILKISRTANATFQNKINRSVIFNYLSKSGPTYRARISKDLNISAPAVSRAIDKLIEDGYVIETKKIITNSGKRPIQLKINSEKGIVLGIDLIKERIKIAVTDFSGEIINTYHGFKGNEKIDVDKNLVEEIKSVLNKCGQGGGIVEKTLNLKAIGVGIPAVINVNSGAVTNAPLYGSLRGLNLKEKLEDYFNVPIYVENVVKLSALGEKNNGEGKNYKNIVLIEISNGIGAGIIVDNHLPRGTYGSAGEIGFSIINNKNLGFIIKNKGWLEKNASVESIKERAAKKIQKGAKTLILDFINKDINNLNPSIVCEAAVRNDKVSKDIISEIVEYLALVP